ncbi:MAG: MFS transporter [Calditrichaceae bacterium]|jgi:DHA1 family tetracycline resistance protein-like MFS transporter
MFKNNKPLTTIFIIAFLNLIGFGIIIPLLPYYAETFGATATDIGFLIASYAAAQFIGSPIWGRFSDRYGRRPALMISVAGASIGYIIFGLANSLTVLFLSRIFAGFMGGNISVAQAYIADVTDEKDRAKGLGLVGAAFGLGFITGPAIGGALSNWGFEIPAFAAALLDFSNFIAIYFWLPESLTRAQMETNNTSRGPGFSLIELYRALTRPLVGALLNTQFIFSLAFAMFTTVFALFAQHRLHLDAQVTGYILAYVGLLIVIVQGGLIGKLTAYFSEGFLLFWSTALMGITLLAWAFVGHVWTLLIMLVPLALASGVFRTVIGSSLSKAVSKEEIGGTMGISSSIDSLTRVIAPTAGGFVLGHYGSSAPGIASAILLALFIPYAWRKFISKPHPALNSNVDG